MKNSDNKKAMAKSGNTKFKIKKYDGTTNEELFKELQARGFYVVKIGLDNGSAPQDIDYLVVTCSPPKSFNQISLSKSN